MVIVKCPTCGKKNFYFDSPSHNIYHLLYRVGVFYIKNVEENKRVIRTADRVEVFISEVLNPFWGWTCESCNEDITSDMKQWKQLKKQALEYLNR